MRHLIPCIMLVLCVSACSTFTKEKKQKTDELPSAEALYNEAFDLFERDKVDDAVKKFEDIERTYPYSEWATRAQLMAAYMNFEAQKYQEAVVGLDRFIKLHPGYKDVAYAFYLRGLAYYEQISDVGRDQSYTAKSQESLREVVARFPQSEYAKDARLKLDLVKDHLAGKEMEIGRFYMQKHKLSAAINRYQAVVDKYQTTSHVAEALYRLVEAYTALGVHIEAQKYGAVLGYNFPGSRWYERAFRLITGETLDVDGQTPAWYERFKLSIPFITKKKEENVDEEALKRPNR